MQPSRLWQSQQPVASVNKALGKMNQQLIQIVL